jgi:2'-5' RNA ligase
MGKKQRKESEPKTLYFVALLLPEAVTAPIMALKEEFAATYGPRHALKLLPHITLVAPFRLRRADEPALQRALARLLKGWKPFTVELDGFGSFRRPEGSTFFIGVRPGRRLEQLHETLQQGLEECLHLPAGPPRAFHPHLSIAHRDLDARTAKQATEDFRDRSFAAVFDAGAVCLFRHDGKYWRQLGHYAAGEDAPASC